MDVNRRKTITVNKKRYSEWVIQNSLYWMSAYCQWSLAEDENNWIVSFREENEEMEFELNKLLNDYLLREKMMQKTGQVRDSIITGVLQTLQSRIEK